MEIEPQLESLENFVSRRTKLSFENKKVQLHFAGTNTFYVPSVLLLAQKNSGFHVEKMQFEPVIIADVRRSGILNTRVPNCNFRLMIDTYLRTVLKIEPDLTTVARKTSYFLEAIRYYSNKKTSIYELLRNAD